MKLSSMHTRPLIQPNGHVKTMAQEASALQCTQMSLGGGEGGWFGPLNLIGYRVRWRRTKMSQSLIPVSYPNTISGLEHGNREPLQNRSHGSKMEKSSDAHGVYRIHGKRRSPLQLPYTLIRTKRDNRGGPFYFVNNDVSVNII